jgi:osmotically-inducible protein OsmY
MAPESERVPHYMVQRVREALAHDPRVNELEIKVKIYGSRVYLSGTIPTEERRAAIGEIVREVLPDHEVHNETSVETLSRPADVERLS